MALSISLVTSSYLLPPGHQDSTGRRWAGQNAWRPHSCWSQCWPIPPLSCLSLLALPGYAICLTAAVICLLPTDTCSPDLSHTPDPWKRHHFNVTTSTIEHCIFRLSGPPLRAPLGMWGPTCPSHRWHVNQASSYHQSTSCPTSQMPPGNDPWMTSATTWIHHSLCTVARASVSTSRIANGMKLLGTVRRAQGPLVSLQPYPSDSPRRKCPHLQPGLSSLRNTHLSPTCLSRCASWIPGETRPRRDSLEPHTDVYQTPADTSSTDLSVCTCLPPGQIAACVICVS